MGTQWSRSDSSLCLLPETERSGRRQEDGASEDESVEGFGRPEDIARFPYEEFTGTDSITCPSCQGTGRIPSDQVHELVALIPYSDQRLKPQRTKLYVVLSVVLCLLASVLVAFFLFPRSVVVVDDGVRSVTVHFDSINMRVLMNMTSTLNLSNPNFFSVLVQSVSCQVLYMKTVVGTRQLDNVTTVLPLSQTQFADGTHHLPADNFIPLEIFRSSPGTLLYVGLYVDPVEDWTGPVKGHRVPLRPTIFFSNVLSIRNKMIEMRLGLVDLRHLL